MAGGWSKILTIIHNVGAGVNSVAISSDGQLVAVGGDDAVCVL